MRTSLVALWLDLRLLARHRPERLLIAALVLMAVAWLSRPDEIVVSRTPIQDDPRNLMALHEFERIRIPASNLTTTQESLVNLASATGLQILRTDFLPEQAGQASFRRVGTRIAASGSYAQWHQYLKRALAEQPALVIRQLNLERADLSTGERLLRGTLTVEFIVGGNAT